MKKYFSILIVIALLVSLFTVTAVAFAEEPDPSTGGSETSRVSFDLEAYQNHVLKYKGNEDGEQRGDDFYLEMNREFMFANKWWEDAQKVHDIFPGINYRYQPKADLEGKETEYTVTYDLKNPVEEDNKYTNTTVSDDSYKETQHFKLHSAPIVIEDDVPVEGDSSDGGDSEPQTEKKPRAYFAGWEISYTPVEGEETPELPVHLVGVFAAGADIAMPAHNITVSAVWKETEEEAEKAVVHDDYIYLFYISPSGSENEDIEDWSRCQVTGTLSLTSYGTWFFRFGVVDGEKGSVSGYSFKEEDLLATTYDKAQEMIDAGTYSDQEIEDERAKCRLAYWTKDNTAPVIKLSTTQENKVRDGLVVGTNYSVSTSLDITDCSSTTVTYLVYKNVGKDVKEAEDGWLLIFDSSKSSDKVTKGYENNISTSGVITPLAEDVRDEAVYKIVYTVEDTYHNRGVAKAGDELEYHPEMLLRVTYAPEQAQTNARVAAWKIVLYVIAGLSAVGIVVLLCIKPKQATSDARYNASNANGQDANSDDNNDHTEE